MEIDKTTSTPVWGLRNDVFPSFGARLVQEGNHLHYLADRAGIYGEFTPAQLQILDAVFPKFIKRMEVALRSGALNPREARRFTTEHRGITCEADTCGSFGYVYLSLYPTIVKS
ncbi:type IV toxin-antitoxin system YeeU family antitoxin [Citrobacter sp. Igbk 14]|uniref:type IV toxin-antitoxin system YeeU family antitoxin n=1 Tax=Citrobacter sp. Igbk 14 TaxID=2963960 RepID=UPI002303C927|nr:type IV toxin-antitoxin system YeeU family antitoxin [Citrobacter sp. Igbk 14]MDA8513667.1 type IV toxin-antitoxin system YeeU family antitoxin [Citrobacter sp. Igbk 14]